MKLKALSVAIVCCLVFSSGCGKKIKSITDFSKYANMTRETDRIEVTYDNNSGSPFYFTIEKQEDIRQIMSIIFSSTFKNMGKELFAGDNTYISIIQGEHKYNLHLLMNKEGKNYYSFATDDLQKKINELARNAGAYNKNTPQDPVRTRSDKRVAAVCVTAFY